MKLPAIKLPKLELPAWLRRALLPGGIFLVAFLTVAVAQRDHGVVRDESVYLDAASRQADWYLGLFSGKAGFSDASITRHFGGKAATANNREHPPLMKTLFGLSERLVHRGLGLTSSLTAYRLPTAAVNALLVMLVFLLVASIWGRAEGVVAALLVLLLPRAFFHSGLATFDAPIAAAWFAVLYAYYRALASRRWVWVLGVAFGCALATKHNAIILPAALVAHYGYLWFRTKSRFGPRPSIGLALVVGGPLVLFLLWPWLWHHPIDRIGDWLDFHFHHVHYNYEYLGENWNHTPYPWHAPIVTTLFTVPVVTLAAGALGAVILLGRALRGQAAEPARAPALLLFLSAGVAMGPFLLTSQPIFGAEKHWAAAIPTIAGFAAVGVVWAARLAAERLVAAELIAAARLPLARTVAVVAVAALVAGAAAAETATAQPYALSHYNALAGGPAGGADLGMNRQFWGYSADGVLPFLNFESEAAGKPIKLYAHDADMTFGVYRRDGRVSGRIQVTGREEQGIRDSDLALVVHERHFNRHDYMIWKDYGTLEPVLVLRYRGVPLVSLYRRPARR